jgi:hypothetical protein
MAICSARTARMCMRSTPSRRDRWMLDTKSATLIAGYVSAMKSSFNFCGRLGQMNDCGRKQSVKARGGGRHSLKAADTENNLMVESVKRQDARSTSWSVQNFIPCIRRCQCSQFFS